MDITPPPEYKNVIFPARNYADVLHQKANNISGQNLLDSYLQSRVPAWTNQSGLFSSSNRANAEIRGGRRVWKVHVEILEKRLPLLLQSLSGKEQSTSDGDYTVFVSDDNPVALDDLLAFLYSAEVPRHTPLQRLGDWERIMGLWRIAEKYKALSLMDDITAIILASAPVSQTSPAILVDIIKVLNGSNVDIHWQAALFVNRLIGESSNYVRDGGLDRALVPSPLINPQMVMLLDEERIESLTVAEKTAYRNVYFFHWTGRLLRHAHDLDDEKPEDWSYPVAIWDMANRRIYTRLSHHLRQMMIDTMSLRHIQNHVTVMEIMSPFIALSNTAYNARLQRRFIRKVLAECPLTTDCHSSWSCLSGRGALIMCRACLREIARESANTVGTGPYQCTCDSCSGILD